MGQVEGAGDAPRLAWLQASNYRSVGPDVTVEFGDLTVLVGPNGAGKSTLLDVVRFLRDALTLGLEAAVAARLGLAGLRRADAGPAPVRIAVGVDGPSGECWAYRLRLDAAGHGGYALAEEELTYGDGATDPRTLLHVEAGRVLAAPAGLAPIGSPRDLALPGVASHPTIRPLVDVLRGVRVHGVVPRDLAAPQAAGGRPPLDDAGANWCAALDALPPGRRADLDLALHGITGDITGLRVTDNGGYRIVEFGHDIGGRTHWFAAAQESEGTLRLAGILTALLQDPVPPFLAVEEPELTVDPGLLPLVYDHLAEAADRTQVVVTTHSPELLDLLDVADVRLVQRRAGATRVDPVSDVQRGIVGDGLATPGELLRTGGFLAPDDATMLDLARDTG